MLLQLPRARCLSILGTASSFVQVKQVHAQLIINSLLVQPAAVAELIEQYFFFTNGEKYAHLVYHQSDFKEITSNVMICYSQPKEALLFFAHHIMSLVVPDSTTYSNVLRACTGLNAHREGMQVHAQILKSGFWSDISLRPSVIHFYASSKDVASARRLFDEMPTRNPIVWNSTMTGYCLNGLPKEAFVLFRNMLQDNVETTERTALALLSACSQLGALATGNSIHAFILKTIPSYQNCVFIGTALVDMYSKCGCLTSALRVFRIMFKRNILTWSAMITGLAFHGKGKAALQLLDEMEKEGLAPNAVTFTSLLSACCHSGMVDEGLYLFHAMRNRFDIVPCMQHYGCIVDLLGRAGMVEEAHAFVKGMPLKPDAVVWRALLGACRMYRHYELGECIGKILVQLENKTPLRIHSCEDYIALSNIYASTERWDDVSMLRQTMINSRIENKPGCSSISIV